MFDLFLEEILHYIWKPTSLIDSFIVDINDYFYIWVQVFAWMINYCYLLIYVIITMEQSFASCICFLY